MVARLAELQARSLFLRGLTKLLDRLRLSHLAGRGVADGVLAGGLGDLRPCYARHELTLAKSGEARPGFHAAVYSLDTVLPVVDLRQQDIWIPQGVAQWWAWASILAGWVLTTAVVAALTGLLKRD